uniref:RRM domain-containing protein n=1 Tax=Rhabditophanes sp. KR3021 TaxID=114890 RepID=A0AC35UGE5_9BILA
MVSRNGSPMNRSRSPLSHCSRYSRSPLNRRHFDRRSYDRYSRSPGRDIRYDRYSRSPGRDIRYYRYSRSPRRDTRYDRYYSPKRSYGSNRYEEQRSPTRYDNQRSDGYKKRRFNDGRENPEVSNCLGVFGMSTRTNEKDIRRIFEKYGPVNDIQIVYDRHTKLSRGYAFVYFERTADATKAKEDMKGQLIDNIQVRIDYSVTKKGRNNERVVSNYSPGRRFRSRS